MITPAKFIEAYREAFGSTAKLPIVFWYSNTPVTDTPMKHGCIFQVLYQVGGGVPVTLHEDNVSCGGARYYTGFGKLEQNKHLKQIQEEHYKDSTQRIDHYVSMVDQQPAPLPYLNFARIDQVATLDDMEGMFFYATPDILSGLTAWAYFDNNDEQSVASIFGSGCSSMVQHAVKENRLGGQRTFLALFDPSVRPFVGADELGFVIPRTRFETMQKTLLASGLFSSFAWKKVRERIGSSI